VADQVNHDRYSDDYIRAILESVKSIAIVGASPKDVRPSYFVARYLIDKGYRVFPINPGQGGKAILGRTIYESLAAVPEPIDMVDIFRSSEYAPRIVTEALSLNPRPKVIWMQLGIRNDEAAAMAEAAGLKVVMNRCPKIEYGRLSGEIGWTGVNTRVISSKKPILRGGAQSWGLAPAAREPRR
jgi:predicted CoA-binding protein